VKRRARWQAVLDAEIKGEVDKGTTASEPGLFSSACGTTAVNYVELSIRSIVRRLLLHMIDNKDWVLMLLHFQLQTELFLDGVK